MLYETYILGHTYSRSDESLAEAVAYVKHLFGEGISITTCGLARIYFMPNTETTVILATTIPDFKDQPFAVVFKNDLWRIINTLGQYYDVDFENSTAARAQMEVLSLMSPGSGTWIAE